MTYITAEVRRQVIDRSGGCCEYCLLNRKYRLFSFEVDHVIAEKHGGRTEIDNLCLSCPECNGYKGSDIASIDPQTGHLSYLFNPRTQAWEQHFRLNGAIIEPLSSEGRVTVMLLRLNDTARIAERTELLAGGFYPCNH